MTTAIIHHSETCRRVFSRLDADCPRCQELKAGSPAREGWGGRPMFKASATPRTTPKCSRCGTALTSSEVTLYRRNCQACCPNNHHDNPGGYCACGGRDFS